MKYHENKCHFEELKNFPFTCKHAQCNKKFKTKSEKLSHHLEKEASCFNDHTVLLKILAECKWNLKGMVDCLNTKEKAEIKLDLENLEATFNKKFEESENKEMFKSIVGNNFISEF